MENINSLETFLRNPHIFQFLGDRFVETKFDSPKLLMKAFIKHSLTLKIVNADKLLIQTLNHFDQLFENEVALSTNQTHSNQHFLTKEDKSALHVKFNSDRNTSHPINIKANDDIFNEHGNERKVYSFSQLHSLFPDVSTLLSELPSITDIGKLNTLQGFLNKTNIADYIPNNCHLPSTQLMNHLLACVVKHSLILDTNGIDGAILETLHYFDKLLNEEHYSNTVTNLPHLHVKLLLSELPYHSHDQSYATLVSFLSQAGLSKILGSSFNVSSYNSTISLLRAIVKKCLTVDSLKEDTDLIKALDLYDNILKDTTITTTSHTTSMFNISDLLDEISDKSDRKRLKILVAFLSQPNLENQLGPNFNKSFYPNVNSFLRRVFKESLTLKHVQNNHELYEVINHYNNLLNPTSITIPLIPDVNILIAELPQNSDQKQAYLVENFLKKANLIEIIGPAIKSTELTSNKLLLQEIIQRSEELDYVQNNLELLNALNYYKNMIISKAQVPTVSPLKHFDTYTFLDELSHISDVSKLPVMLQFLTEANFPVILGPHFDIAHYQTSKELLHGIIKESLASNYVNRNGTLKDALEFYNKELNKENIMSHYSNNYTLPGIINNEQVISKQNFYNVTLQFVTKKLLAILEEEMSVEGNLVTKGRSIQHLSQLTNSYLNLDIKHLLERIIHHFIEENIRQSDFLRSFYFSGDTSINVRKSTTPFTINILNKAFQNSTTDKTILHTQEELLTTSSSEEDNVNMKPKINFVTPSITSTLTEEKNEAHIETVNKYETYDHSSTSNILNNTSPEPLNYIDDEDIVDALLQNPSLFNEKDMTYKIDNNVPEDRNIHVYSLPNPEVTDTSLWDNTETTISHNQNTKPLVISHLALNPENQYTSSILLSPYLPNQESVTQNLYEGENYNGNFVINNLHENIHIPTTAYNKNNYIKSIANHIMHSYQSSSPSNIDKSGEVHTTSESGEVKSSYKEEHDDVQMNKIYMTTDINTTDKHTETISTHGDDTGDIFTNTFSSQRKNPKTGVHFTEFDSHTSEYKMYAFQLITSTVTERMNKSTIIPNIYEPITKYFNLGNSTLLNQTKSNLTSLDMNESNGSDPFSTNMQLADSASIPYLFTSEDEYSPFSNYSNTERPENIQSSKLSERLTTDVTALRESNPYHSNDYSRQEDENYSTTESDNVIYDLETSTFTYFNDEYNDIFNDTMYDTNEDTVNFIHNTGSIHIDMNPIQQTTLVAGLDDSKFININTIVIDEPNVTTTLYDTISLKLLTEDFDRKISISHNNAIDTLHRSSTNNDLIPNYNDNAMLNYPTSVIANTYDDVDNNITRKIDSYTMQNTMPDTLSYGGLQDITEYTDDEKIIYRDENKYMALDNDNSNEIDIDDVNERERNNKLTMVHNIPNDNLNGIELSNYYHNTRTPETNTNVDFIRGNLKSKYNFQVMTTSSEMITDSIVNKNDELNDILPSTNSIKTTNILNIAENNEFQFNENSIGTDTKFSDPNSNSTIANWIQDHTAQSSGTTNTIYTDIENTKPISAQETDPHTTDISEAYDIKKEFINEITFNKFTTTSLPVTFPNIETLQLQNPIFNSQNNSQWDNENQNIPSDVGLIHNTTINNDVVSFLITNSNKKDNVNTDISEYTTSAYKIDTPRIRSSNNSLKMEYENEVVNLHDISNENNKKYVIHVEDDKRDPNEINKGYILLNITRFLSKISPVTSTQRIILQGFLNHTNLLEMIGPFFEENKLPGPKQILEEIIAQALKRNYSQNNTKLREVLKAYKKILNSSEMKASDVRRVLNQFSSEPNNTKVNNIVKYYTLLRNENNAGYDFQNQKQALHNFIKAALRSGDTKKDPQLLQALMYYDNAMSNGELKRQLQNVSLVLGEIMKTPEGRRLKLLINFLQQPNIMRYLGNSFDPSKFPTLKDLLQGILNNALHTIDKQKDLDLIESLKYFKMQFDSTL